MASSKEQREQLLAALEGHIGGHNPDYVSQRQPGRTVFLVVVQDSPRPGLWTASTVGMSDQPMGDGKHYEILVAGRDQKMVVWIAAAAADVLAEHGAAPLYGRPFSGLAEIAMASTLPPHGLFVRPNPWDEEIASLPLPQGEVELSWLVMITDEEMEALRSGGLEALEQLLTKNQVDLLDLSRK